MFEVDLCIRIRGYHQLNFHQLVHDRPNDLCDWLRMGQMASAKLFLWVGFYLLVEKKDWTNPIGSKLPKDVTPRGKLQKFTQTLGLIWSF